MLLRMVEQLMEIVQLLPPEPVLPLLPGVVSSLPPAAAVGTGAMVFPATI